MHIKVKDIDKFSAIKEETCWALCESLNNKVLPNMGPWEKTIRSLYILVSWVPLLSVLFYLR